MSDVASGVFLNSESVVVVSGIEGLLETVRGIHSFALRNRRQRTDGKWLGCIWGYGSLLICSQVYKFIDLL